MNTQRTYGYDLHLNIEGLNLVNDTIFERLKSYNTIWLDSGRSCITLLGSLIKGKEILVPAFSCKAVIHAFSNEITPVFYNINPDFTIDFNDLASKITSRTAAIYITDYYGKLQDQTSCEKLNMLRDQYALLIFEDTTQSIFSGIMSIGDYALASLRKWFAVPDGAVIYSKKSLDFAEVFNLQKGSLQICKIYPQILKSMFIDNWVEYSAVEIAKMFDCVEKKLDIYTAEKKIFLMSDFTRFIYSCNDIGKMINLRKRNEKILRSVIDSSYVHFVHKQNENDCPFSLPMYCKTRDKLWNYLQKNFSIFPSVLWRTNEYPEVNHIGEVNRMGREIISLPIDQRYGEEDMFFIGKALNSYSM